MSRDSAFKEMTEMFGFVPEFIKTIPASLIDSEWEVFKQLQVEEHHIPGKYKELGGLMVSAVTKCKYCTYFHTAFAKLMGASDGEIQEAIHYAKATAGWSAYINGTQQDYKEFTKEIDRICDHVSKAMAAHAG